MLGGLCRFHPGRVVKRGANAGLVIGMRLLEMTELALGADVVKQSVDILSAKVANKTAKKKRG
jgi:hypothetical protein